MPRGIALPINIIKYYFKYIFYLSHIVSQVSHDSTDTYRGVALLSALHLFFEIS
jgi:hypothetical protein